MKNQSKKTKQLKLIEKIIRQVWVSLESHLEYTHSPNNELGRHIKDREVEKKKLMIFHQMCVKEYARLIRDISELY